MTRSAATRIATRDSTTGAVLFDIDGTLVDTNYLHAYAWLAAFRAVGHPVDGAAIHRAIGTGSSQLLDRLLGSEAARHVGDRAKDEHKARYQETYPRMRRFEGAAELLRAVASRATVVLASSASPARAGVPCVAVLSGGISRAELAEAGAVAVYDDAAELLSCLELSPLGLVLGG